MNTYSRSASSEPSTYIVSSMPFTSLDSESGVLYVWLEEPSEPTTSILDDEEIFVFSGAQSGRTVAFSVPNYDTYWNARREELFAHLASYLMGREQLLTTALYGGSVTTPSDYRAASVA